MPVPMRTLEEAFGIPSSHVRRLLANTSERLRRDLRLREQPFAVTNEAVSTTGIAGITRLDTGIELEVVPKCFRSNSISWRDDFLVIAALTKLGRLLRRERVSAGLQSEHRDFLTLLAMAFLDDFERLSRVPIREYRNYYRVDPSLDAELDYTEVWVPRPEGFLQRGPVLSMDNQFMQVIGSAASYLSDVSTDRGVSQRLRRLSSGFPRVVHSRIRNRVPGRFARWQPLYELSLAVREGLGLQFRTNGGVLAPGFVLNTERGWEDLLTMALIAQGSNLRARAKPASKLGIRSPSMSDVVTYPDVVLTPARFQEPIVVDAKYKGTAGRVADRVSNDDLYEVLAFLTAQRASVAVLIYPDGGLSPADTEPGALVPFDEVAVGSRRVVGARVSVKGIGQTRGFAEFGHRLGQHLLQIARDAGVPVS